MIMPPDILVTIQTARVCVCVHVHVHVRACVTVCGLGGVCVGVGMQCA